MVDAALGTFREVDLLVLVMDAADRLGNGDRYVLDLMKRAPGPVFLVLNKIDLIKKTRLLPLIDRLRQEGSFKEIVPVSARTGENVASLEQAILDALPAGEPLYPEDYLTDKPERFFAAEIVREKLLEATRAEIPFASAVVVDAFEEPAAEGGTVRLYCTIVVDRESQKGIVVGKGGGMVKRIGTAARLELERFFGAHVFLDLRVRVKADWRDNDQVLETIGVLPRRRQSEG